MKDCIDSELTDLPCAEMGLVFRNDCLLFENVDDRFDLIPKTQHKEVTDSS